MFCKMERWDSLEHLKICEAKKKTSSLKVGSVGHRWMRGTERRLEQLMMLRGL